MVFVLVLDLPLGRLDAFIFLVSGFEKYHFFLPPPPPLPLVLLPPLHELNVIYLITPFQLPHHKYMWKTWLKELLILS